MSTREGKRSEPVVVSDERHSWTTNPDPTPRTAATARERVDVDAVIRNWWNDGPRKTWRKDFADPDTRRDWLEELGRQMTRALAAAEAPGRVAGEVKPHTVIYDNVDWCIEHERWELMPGTGPTIIPAPAPLPARGEPMTEPTTEAQAIAWAEHSLERNAAVAALFRLLPDSMFPESFDALMERVVAIETIAATCPGTPAPAPTPSEPVAR